MYRVILSTVNGQIESRFGKKLEVCALLTLALCVFFASWTDSFRIGRWVTPSSVSAAMAIIACAAYALTQKVTIRWQHIFLIIFLACAIIAATISPNDKSLSYLAAYLFSFVGLGVVMPVAMEALGRKYADIILNINAVAVIFVAIFCIFEFSLRYYWGWNVQDFVPRLNPARSYIWIFPRVYGFSEEPTYVSWYFNTLGILGIYRIWGWSRPFIAKSSYTAAIIVAAASTWSVAGMLGLFSAAVVVMGVLLVRHRAALAVISRRALWPATCSTLIAALIAVAIVAPPFERYLQDPAAREMADFSNEPAVEDVWERTFSKLAGTTGDARQERWARDIDRMMERPVLGWGPGYISSLGEGSSNNLLIFLGAEIGILSVLLIIAAGIAIIVPILRSRDPRSLVWLFALIAGAVHLMSLSQFYHPSVWLVIATFFMMDFDEERPAAI